MFSKDHSKIKILAFCLVCPFVWLGLSSLTLGQAPIEIFQDPTFQRGFNVVSNSEHLGTIFAEPRVPSTQPYWTLGTHYSRFNIVQSPEKIDETSKEIHNPGKTIRLFQNDQDETVLQLEVHAEQEYATPRKEGEPWVHLLLQHDFEENERMAFAQMPNCIFSMDVRIKKCENCMAPDDFDIKIHCGQATSYFVLANDTPSSPDYHDYIWFGIPLFDSRYETPASYVALDGNPEVLGTGKLIYIPESGPIFQENYHGVNPYFHEWAHLDIDLCHYIPLALQAAHERGLLTSTSLSDLKLGHFNLGWEVPGTFDCSLEIKNLRLYVDPSPPK